MTKWRIRESGICLLVAAVAGVVVGCYGDDDPCQELPLVTLQASGELERSFTRLEEIVPASNVIAVIDVLSSEHEGEGFPTTTSKVMVREVLSGDVAAGDVLTVTEVGGPVRRQSKLDPEKYGEARFIVVDGVAPMTRGETYLVFLTGPSPYGAVLEVYTPQGAFQGKVRLNSDGVLTFTGDSSLLKQDTYQLLKYLDGKWLADIKGEILSHGIAPE